MINSTDTKIKALRPWQVTTLHRLFVAALDADFTFIDPADRARIKTQNSRAHLAASLVHHHRHIFLAWQNGEAIGYIIAGTDVDKSGNIDWLYVKPGHRGQNICNLNIGVISAVTSRATVSIPMLSFGVPIPTPSLCHRSSRRCKRIL